MRDVGTVQHRLREDAASADAKARMEDGGWKMEEAGAAFWAKSMTLTERSGEKSPARAIGFIPLTFIPLTFPLSFRFSPALNGWRQFRDNLRYFELIRDNLTSRQGEGGTAIRQNHAVSRRFLPRIARIARMEVSLFVLSGSSVVHSLAAAQRRWGNRNAMKTDSLHWGGGGKEGLNRRDLRAQRTIPISISVASVPP